MEPRNKINSLFGSRGYSRVRPRRKQGHVSELNLDKSYPLARTTKTWTPASLLDRLRTRRAPARHFYEEVDVFLRVRSNRSVPSVRDNDAESDVSHRSDSSHRSVAEPSMRETQ